MSAAGRGAVRALHDYYPTPAWALERFLEAHPIGGQWLEPSAGDGALLRVLRGHPHAEVDLTAMDLNPRNRLGRYLDPGQPFIWRGDFLAHPPVGFDGVIGNPPYEHAEAFVRQGLAAAPVVAYLLRLNFLEGLGRAPLLHAFPPDVYVLPNRPSFRWDGKTDATAYAWIVFRREMRGAGSVQVLDTTPAAVRRAQREQLLERVVRFAA